MDLITGFLHLPGPVPVPAHVRVALIDATSADAPATLVAQTSFVAPAAARLPIPFRLQRPALSQGGQRWLFEAMVSRRPSELRPGDFLLTASVEFDAALAHVPIDLTLTLVT